eukprot:COSAG02_NODE_59933_length_272_cov_3.248555_1_plen_31_part_10
MMKFTEQGKFWSEKHCTMYYKMSHKIELTLQ